MHLLGPYCNIHISKGGQFRHFLVLNSSKWRTLKVSRCCHGSLFVEQNISFLSILWNRFDLSLCNLNFSAFLRLQRSGCRHARGLGPDNIGNAWQRCHLGSRSRGYRGLSEFHEIFRARSLRGESGSICSRSQGIRRKEAPCRRQLRMGAKGPHALLLIIGGERRKTKALQASIKYF